MTSRSLGHRAPLLWVVLPLIGGLGLGKALDAVSVGWLLALAFVLAVVAATSGRRPRLWVLTLSGAMLLAGMAAYALHRARLPSWENLPAREARLELRVDRVFPGADQRRCAGLATITQADAHLRDLVGQKLYFSLGLRATEPRPVRSSTVSAVGVLVTLPRNPSPHTFESYLAGAGINFRLTRGRILAEVTPAQPYYRFCANAAARFKIILGIGIAEKQPTLAGLLRAMMLGETHELSDEQHALFMQSGTMHLFAISGLNIAVIAGILQALLLLLRLPAWPRFLIGTALLWLFVDITGAAPSAVRAFVMAAFLKGALVLRLPTNPLSALAASALLVLILAPLQVFSASFLMSYGIVTALLVLGLPLSEAWLARWTPWRDVPPATWTWVQKGLAATWHSTATALAIGTSAMLVSLLTGVEFFRLLTPGTLFANLALIPAAIVATLAGFASLLCGLVGFTAGASLCNHAAALVLFGIERLVGLSVQVPGTHLAAEFVTPWLGRAAIATLVVLLLVGYGSGWRRERGGWWPPFALVTLVLLFGVKLG